MKRIISSVLLATLMLVSGCTIHPQGESHERDLASQEGEPYTQRIEDRHLPALGPDPTPQELVRYAWLASPQLEQRYWEWNSAIEQIPQDGSQPTNLVLFGDVPITHGSTAFNKTVVTLSNDPMADIQWPSKPSAAARRALEQARAAGWRFQQAKLDIRQRVLVAYDEYALNAQLLRLEETNTGLLSTTAELAQANIGSGRTTQAASLSAANEAELSKNQAAELRSKLPALRATLNAALGRDPAAPLSPPKTLPPLRIRPASPPIPQSPELAAEDAEVRARQQAIQLSKLQYVPDFSLSGSTDLAGITQSLSAMVTLPLLKYQAINAAIAQAESNLRASQAARRQTELDLQSRLIADKSDIDDLNRQVHLLEQKVIPTAESIATLTQAEYESNQATLMTLLESQRAVIALRRLHAMVSVADDERILDMETAQCSAQPRVP